MKIEVKSIEDLTTLLSGVKFSKLIVRVQREPEECSSKPKKEASTTLGLNAWILANEYKPSHVNRSDIMLSISLKELYEAYSTYCLKSDFAAVSNYDLSRFLAKSGFKPQRKMDGIYYWVYK